VRGFAWNVFGTYVVVFLIPIAVQILLSISFAALPLTARSFIADIVSGTLIAPFIAITVSLVWYRLTAAHANQAPPGYGHPSPPPPVPSDQSAPPFARDGPSGGDDVVSPGGTILASGNLPGGTYGLLCFIADDMTGIPHAIMGMHEVIELK